MKLYVPVAALALAGSAALIAPGVLAEDSARDAVEKLMPQLLSEDESTRTDAEKKLFQLGPAGKAELERITRETDPRRAVTALRLLQSPKWGRSKLRAGERAAQKEIPFDDGFVGPHGLLDDDFRARMERHFEDLRRRFDEMDRSFSFEMPDLSSKGFRGRSSGSIVENDRKLSWTLEDDGSLKVTTQDGKDAPETKYEAKSLDELRKEHPDVAQRLDKVLPRVGRHGFSFHFGHDLLRDLEPFDRGRRGRDRDLAPRDERELDLPAPAAQPVLGIEWSPMSDVLREHVGTSGVVVESVVPASLAEKLGLMRHDVLLEINGKAISGSGDVRAALSKLPAGEDVKASIVRKGARKTLETKK